MSNYLPKTDIVNEQESALTQISLSYNKLIIYQLEGLKYFPGWITHLPREFYARAGLSAQDGG